MTNSKQKKPKLKIGVQMHKPGQSSEDARREMSEKLGVEVKDGDAMTDEELEKFMSEMGITMDDVNALIKKGEKKAKGPKFIQKIADAFWS